MLREFDKYRKDGYIDLNQLDAKTEDKNLPPNIHFLLCTREKSIM